jgi:hypothetical protein
LRCCAQPTWRARTWACPPGGCPCPCCCGWPLTPVCHRPVLLPFLLTPPHAQCAAAALPTVLLCHPPHDHRLGSLTRHLQPAPPVRSHRRAMYLPGLSGLHQAAKQDVAPLLTDLAMWSDLKPLATALKVRYHVQPLQGLCPCALTWRLRWRDQTVAWVGGASLLLPAMGPRVLLPPGAANPCVMLPRAGDWRLACWQLAGCSQCARSPSHPPAGLHQG